MAGQAICRKHGGKAGQNLAAAERRLDQAEAQAIVRRLLHDTDAPPCTDPIGELQRVVGRMGSAVEVLGERVNETQGLDYTDANMVRRLHVVVEAWRDLTVEYRKALTDMVRLGIEARAQQVAEEQARLLGGMLAGVIQRVLGDLDLSPAQLVLVGEVVPRHLRAIEGVA